MRALRDFHELWAYVAVVANGVVGIAALVAWRVVEIRGRWLWWAIAAAQGAMMAQVVTGVILQSGDEHRAQDFHMFYGFLAFLTVGFAYQYRTHMRGRRELLFGLAQLFLMGLGIRAMLQT
jgi:zinc transporter ZupT